MTAKEARELSKSMPRKEEEKKLEDIMSRIKRSATAGGFMIRVYNSDISGSVRLHLIELGYKIENFSDQRDGSLTTISW